MDSRLITLLVTIFVTSSCYVSKQGYRQLSLLAAREPIERVLEDQGLSKVERAKLEFTQKVLAYAKSEGLKVDDSYRSYVRLKGDAVSYIVQAAKPTELKLKTWWFPIVGSVPYLGFFDKNDRDLEAKKLAQDGYEVHLGAATAYSSLGWFDDPVFSSMLRRSDVDLADLYFHELTHRTIWIEDGVEFNENLAEFVSEELTVEFFRQIGREKELSEFFDNKTDAEIFRAWLGQLRDNVEKNLKSTENLPESQRVTEKNKVIELAISNKPKFKTYDFVGLNPWNNARILAANLYSPDTEMFSKAAKCFYERKSSGRAGEFLKALGQAAEKTSSGFRALELMCAS